MTSELKILCECPECEGKKKLQGEKCPYCSGKGVVKKTASEVLRAAENERQMWAALEE